MAITTVAIGDLSTWLSNQPANTKDTPYELNITGLTTDNVNTIRKSLKNNSTKYVDLSDTTIPNSVTNLYYTFEECTSLVTAPAIPSSVTSLESTFYGCSSLVNAPVIPNSVTKLYGTFSGCTSLVNAPVIPNSVTNMNYAFQNCTSLVNAPVISNSVTNMGYAFNNCASLVNAPVIPNSVTDLYHTFSGCSSLVNAPVIPNSVTNMESTFYGCTSLLKVGILNVDPSEVTYKNNCFTNTPSTLKVYVPLSKLSAWQGITASDWGLSSTSIFKVSTRVKSWLRIA